MSDERPMTNDKLRMTNGESAAPGVVAPKRTRAARHLSRATLPACHSSLVTFHFAPMSPAEAQQRIAELRREVAHHDELYYRRAKPEIADFDYDKLKQELAALENLFPEAAHALGLESPTARVGDDRTEGFARVKHRQAMTTLDNTYDEAELREFHARLAKALGTEDLAYTVEPKIDGVAVRHGRVENVATISKIIS